MPPWGLPGRGNTERDIRYTIGGACDRPANALRFEEDKPGSEEVSGYMLKKISVLKLIIIMKRCGE